MDIVKDNIGDAEYFVMEDEAIDGFSSTIAGGFNSLPKKFHSAKERRRGDFLGFLIVQLGAENQNTFRDIKKFRKKCLPMPKKTVKPILLSCIVTKSLLTMVPHGGTLWKHPRVLFGQVGRTIYSEILINFEIYINSNEPRFPGWLLSKRM